MTGTNRRPWTLRRKGIIHYGPGDRPLCGDDSPYAVYTEEPDQVASCENRLEAATEDLQ